MTTQQLHFIDVLLPLSEEELLYEIANGRVSNIQASAGPRPSLEERMRRFMERVPDKPVSEYVKPFLKDFIDSAQQDAALFRRRLYGLLCNRETKQPTNLVADITTGTIKDVIVMGATLLYTTYQTQMAVAIPVTVFALKYGLQVFCSTSPDDTSSAL
ncbi:hypothetical protein [Hymenobacter terrenus]|uniref:hypothetical protein n=1 Tax=Hymenobacter terrenus TaxID=1629124 RepID=UPI000619E2E6|nr:hypothetical protein [Hymenobacter terrenus]